ncbi:MAG TPA: hypothetical protein VGR90_02865, partial [Acidimicrobiales bacterium]|nr:hypothetical protein [Acidimicrobiales bacterium]
YPADSLAGRPERAPAGREATHGMAWEYGALLDEALGAAGADAGVGDVVSAGGADVLDSSLVLAVAPRIKAAAGPPADDPAPEINGAAKTVEVSETIGAAEGPDVSGPVDPIGAGVPRPTIVDGRVEIDPGWAERPLLRQPVVLMPGASIGAPGGSTYVANPGSLEVTFVPSGRNDGHPAGTYHVDPAALAAAAGPEGVLTNALMAQLSGSPFRAGPPTPIQMAVIDAARQAGLRLESTA